MHTVPVAAAARAPIYITQQRKVRDFIADQERLAAIKGDWLYRLASPEARARIVRSHGFTPVRERRALIPA